MTGKQAINHAIYDYNNHFKNSKSEEILEGLRKAKKDLENLKKINEKLGYDLIKLFNIDKALIVRKGIDESVIVEAEIFFINPHQKEIAFGNAWSFKTYKIADCGKTWTLKEKLKNGR